MKFSEDQAHAFDAISAALKAAGVDLENSMILPEAPAGPQLLAVLGKAGSGKTMLLSALYKALTEAGVHTISGDYEPRRARDRRTVAILAPTNKAASVLRNQSVPATTIHRILYTPVYDPEYEKIAEWLQGNGDRPEIEGLCRSSRANAFRKYCEAVSGCPAWSSI